MDTKGMVASICKQHDTRDPFELAWKQDIIVLFEPLGTIHGYYAKSHRQQTIHINNQLDDQRKLFTGAHELGHALLHPEMHTPFLRAATMFSVDKMELQANHFATDLIYDDSELLECLHWPIEHVAGWMGVTVALTEYRLSTVQPTLWTQFD